MEETLNNLKETLHPTLFLLHPKIVCNKSLFELILSGSDGMPDCYRFKALKSSSWNANAALEIIHKNLVIRHGSEVSCTTAYQRMRSEIDLDALPIQQSLGALLSFMQNTIFNLDGGKVVVSSIKTISLEKYMNIDASSMKALQIFSEEVHPNVLKGVGRSKVFREIN